jgi:hypothetical protein
MLGRDKVYQKSDGRGTWLEESADSFMVGNEDVVASHVRPRVFEFRKGD